MDGVDSKILDALTQTMRATTMTPEALTATANGKAYQAVAQSAALAIQDAVDALRGTTAIATTASGIALAQFLSTGDPRYLEVLERAQQMVNSAIADFSAIGGAATSLLNEFPSH